MRPSLAPRRHLGNFITQSIISFLTKRQEAHPNCDPPACRLQGAHKEKGTLFFLNRRLSSASNSFGPYVLFLTICRWHKKNVILPSLPHPTTRITPSCLAISKNLPVSKGLVAVTIRIGQPAKRTSPLIVTPSSSRPARTLRACVWASMLMRVMEMRNLLFVMIPAAAPVCWPGDEGERGKGGKERRKCLTPPAGGESYNPGLALRLWLLFFSLCC